MRTSHRFNALHRVERWNGSFYAPSKLWQTGCYLLIPHHEGVPLCDSLLHEINVIEKHQEPKDAEEQRAIAHQYQAQKEDVSARVTLDASRSGENTRAGHWNEEHPYDLPDRESVYVESDECDDEMPGLLEVPSLPAYMDSDDDDDDADADAEMNTAPGAASESMLHETYHASYVRVVHTTGIHSLGMVSCQCRGLGLLPVDLMASHMVPASFEIIRTLFTVQVLDGFRLSNLELHASAYNFYNMLRRITSPLAPSEVVDLHNEFRRMSRLWRWLKKLKWSGYGHNGEKPEEATHGEMAIFCPACPQVDINLPQDWQERRDQWMYRRVFVADGNFKADHVKSIAPSRDYWLIDGAGMAPKREDYINFLKTAAERPTVSIRHVSFFQITHNLSESALRAPVQGSPDCETNIQIMRCDRCCRRRVFATRVFQPERAC